MNWGYKILVVIIVFVVSMFGMVYVSMQQKNDMLDEDYYSEEIHFQKLIDAEENLKKIQTEPIVSQNEDQVIFQLPASSVSHIKEGQIQFLKPNNKDDDVLIQLEPDSSGKFIVAKSQLKKGVYKVRVKWSNDNLLYYTDDSFYIN